jgi:flagellar biosynthesis chaperone FliJ
MRLLLIFLLLVACAENRPTPTVTPPAPPIVPAVVVEPQKDETDLEAMKRERKEAKATIEQLQSKVTNLDSQIKTTEQDRLKWWANLIGAICVGLAAVCLVASFFLMQYPFAAPILRYSAYILGSCGTLAFVYAALVGYFLAIGIGIGVIIVGTAVYLWFNDRKALRQVVTVVEENKKFIPEYKDKFRKKIDAKRDKWINKVRGVN